MRKHIWIIGNDDPACGVSADVNNYYNYFQTPRGGYWNAEEITISKDISVYECRLQINLFKLYRYDYFVLIFSGHGGIARTTNETMLQLSKNSSQLISEAEFAGISARQLNIFDCCRDYYTPAEMVKAARATMLLNASTNSQRSLIRASYEHKISRSACCLHTMYACSPGECARGTSGRGGYFTSILLDISRGWQLSRSDVSVHEIFDPAKEQVKRIAGHTPDCDLPRCIQTKELVWINNPFV